MAVSQFAQNDDEPDRSVWIPCTLDCSEEVTPALHAQHREDRRSDEALLSSHQPVATQRLHSAGIAFSNRDQVLDPAHELAGLRPEVLELGVRQGSERCGVRSLERLQVTLEYRPRRL